MANDVEVLKKLPGILDAKMNALTDLGCDKAVASRIKMIFMLQCRKVPKLLACNIGSLAQAFTDAGAIGIEPDGIHAHLIPYGQECTYMVDYKGYIRLARESGEIADMTANVVRKNDEFSHEYGSNKHLKHIKAMGTDEERGTRIAAYSYVKFKDGSEDFRVLTEGEVMNAKKSSKSGNIWKDHPDAMWAKSAIRQHAKFLPRAKKLQEATHMDELRELKEADITDVTSEATVNKKDALKQKIKDKQESSALPAEDESLRDSFEVTTGIEKITKKKDKSPHKLFGEGGEIYTTFSDSMIKIGEVALTDGLMVKITHDGGKYNAIISIVEIPPKE